jgi:hypothetical protein
MHLLQSAFINYPALRANAVISFQQTSNIKTQTFTATGQEDAFKTHTHTYAKFCAIQ